MDNVEGGNDNNDDDDDGLTLGPKPHFWYIFRSSARRLFLQGD